MMYTMMYTMMYKVKYALTVDCRFDFFFTQRMLMRNTHSICANCNITAYSVPLHEKQEVKRDKNPYPIGFITEYIVTQQYVHVKLIFSAICAFFWDNCYLLQKNNMVHTPNLSNIFGT